MNIHQLSVRYQFEQDRILLSLNTTAGQSVDIWLTRRLTVAMWPQLNHMVISHFAIPADAQSDGFVNLAAMDTQTRTMLADLRRQEVLQKLDFDTPYQTESRESLTGNAPLLATEISLTPRAGQIVQVNFKEQLGPTAQVRNIQLDLNTALVFSLVQMLGQSLKHTQWQMPTQSVVLENNESTPEIVNKRPVYLN